ncbi:hypothetical protein [Streptomyces sp. NPDC005408]|uniref:hypothetical protein n=1 Tax=Streptomyces sp. NPDC005408 TaxID=3155341 RepID=UPI0033B813EA
MAKACATAVWTGTGCRPGPVPSSHPVQATDAAAATIVITASETITVRTALTR